MSRNQCDDKKGRLKTLEMQMLEADLWPKNRSRDRSRLHLCFVIVFEEALILSEIVIPNNIFIYLVKHELITSLFCLGHGQLSRFPGVCQPPVRWVRQIQMRQTTLHGNEPFINVKDPQVRFKTRS